MLCTCRSTKVAALVDLVALIFCTTLNSKELLRRSNFDDWRNCCGTELLYIFKKGPFLSTPICSQGLNGDMELNIVLHLKI